MPCSHKFIVKDKYGEIKYSPCGQCLGCHAKKQRYLSHKIQGDVAHHAKNNIGSSFVTLTVDDSCTDHSVHKKHLQNFIKRLRYYSPVPFKHLSIGDYGENTQRNHYHCLLIGFPSSLSNKIRNSWDFGFSTTDPINVNNINYVVRYISKFTQEYKNLFDSQGLESPFSIRSQDIGKLFFQDNYDLCYETGSYLYKGKPYPISAYDLAKYFGTTPPDPDYQQIIKQARKHKFTDVNAYMDYMAAMYEQNALRRAQNRLKPPQGIKILPSDGVVSTSRSSIPDFTEIVANILY